MLTADLLICVHGLVEPLSLNGHGVYAWRALSADGVEVERNCRRILRSKEATPALAVYEGVVDILSKVDLARRLQIADEGNQQEQICVIRLDDAKVLSELNNDSSVNLRCVGHKAKAEALLASLVRVGVDVDFGWICPDDNTPTRLLALEMLSDHRRSHSKLRGL